MVASRFMFVFIPLFLTLIITISTAPIPDDQLVTGKNTSEATTATEPISYDDDKTESDDSSNEEEEVESTPGEDEEETNTDSEVITSNLLVVNATEILLDVDENLQVIDRLLNELFEITSTENPRSSQINPTNTAEDE